MSIKNGVHERQDAYERGYRTGASFRSENRDYGMVNGLYPSNPYHLSDPLSTEYNLGYVEGFNGR